MLHSLPIRARNFSLILLTVISLSFSGKAQSIDFQGFRNDCANIEFQANLGFLQSFIVQINDVTWDLDGVTLQTGTNQVFLLDRPGTTLTATFTGFSFFGPFNFSLTTETPEISDFFITLSNNGVLNFTDPNQVKIVNATVPRCVGSSSWSTSVEAFNGSSSDLFVETLFESVNSVPSSAQLRVSLTSSQATGTYVVELTAEETLSGNRSTRAILVTVDPFETGCIICPGFRDVANTEELEVIDAAMGGLSREEWAVLEVDRVVTEIIRRQDIERENLLKAEVSEGERVIAFNVFPNPTSDVINIAYGATPQSIRLIDLNGREIARYTSAQIGPDRLSIPVTAVRSGLYILELTDGLGNKQVRKVQVNR